MRQARSAWHLRRHVLCGVAAVAMVLAYLLGADNALAQSDAATLPVPGTVVQQSGFAPTLIYLDWVSHALVGVIAALRSSQNK